MNGSPILSRESLHQDRNPIVNPAPLQARSVADTPSKLMKTSAPLAVAIATVTCLLVLHARGADQDWAGSVKLPPAEKKSRIALFNGRDLAGWEGNVGTYWSVDAGTLRGAPRPALPRHWRLAAFLSS